MTVPRLTSPDSFYLAPPIGLYYLHTHSVYMFIPPRSDLKTESWVHVAHRISWYCMHYGNPMLEMRNRSVCIKEVRGTFDSLIFLTY